MKRCLKVSRAVVRCRVCRRVNDLINMRTTFIDMHFLIDMQIMLIDLINMQIILIVLINMQII
jgi:hypothetical protein